MLKFTVTATPASYSSAIESRTNGAALFAAETARTMMDDYVPVDRGFLRGNVNVSASGNTGKVTYTQPYAKYQYYGNYNHAGSGNPAARSHWDKHINRSALVAAIQSFIGR